MLDTLLDWTSRLPAWAWAILGVVLAYKPAVLLLSDFVAWRGRVATRRAVEIAATNRHQMDLDSGRRKRVVFPPNTSVFDQVENVARAVYYAARRVSYAAEERTRVDSTGELQFWQAFFEAGRAKGIGYLPAKVAPQVQIHLAEALLREADAEAEAFAYLDMRKQELDRNNLCDNLFSPGALTEVDLTPAIGVGSHYFAKYFQPLMVEFASLRFRESCKSLDEEHKVLLQHLRLLSMKRVRAAHVRPEEVDAIWSRLECTLPRRPPSSVGQRLARRDARLFNKKASTVCVLALAEPGHAAALENFLYKVDRRLKAARATLKKRTSTRAAGNPWLVGFYQDT